ncbi:hypothetical protein EGW08_020997, partial [Elysia chlorotica]
VQPLYGRPALLGDCKDHIFVDVVCGSGATAARVFAITSNGDLIIISAQDRRVTHHKNMVGMRGTCIKVHDQVLFLGFSNGDIHMLNATNLLHLGALPPPTFFRASGLNGGGLFTLTFNLCTSYLTAAYKSSSMCVWDLKDVGNVKQKYVAVYHSQGIVSLDVFSSLEASGIRETMVTVSLDATVRFWSVIINKSVCYNNLRIASTDPHNENPGDGIHQTLAGSGIVMVIKISPDQRLIATGDQTGKICIYHRKSMAPSYTVQAHSRGVTCLDFYSDLSRGHFALISGSRDRLVQMMDGASGFRVVSTLSAHSSSITAVKVCQPGCRVCVVSTACDRTINLSQVCTEKVVSGASTTRQLSGLQLIHCLACVSTPTDIAFDHRSLEMAVGFQDGNIRVCEMSQLQEVRIFPGCTTGETQIHRVALDHWAALLLSAASDKTINVIDFQSGKILHTVTGHNKMVTGLAFTSAGNHVISTSMDGCLFLWRLTSELLATRQNIRKTMKGLRPVLHSSVARPSAASHLVLRGSSIPKEDLGGEPEDARPLTEICNCDARVSCFGRTPHSAPPRFILTSVSDESNTPAWSSDSSQCGQMTFVPTPSRRPRSASSPSCLRCIFERRWSGPPTASSQSYQSCCWKSSYTSAGRKAILGSKRPPIALSFAMIDARISVGAERQSSRSPPHSFQPRKSEAFLNEEKPNFGRTSVHLTHEHSPERSKDRKSGESADTRKINETWSTQFEYSPKVLRKSRRRYRFDSPKCVPGQGKRRTMTDQYKSAPQRHAWRSMLNAHRTEALEKNKKKTIKRRSSSTN